MAEILLEVPERNRYKPELRRPPSYSAMTCLPKDSWFLGAGNNKDLRKSGTVNEQNGKLSKMFHTCIPVKFTYVTPVLQSIYIKTPMIH